MDAPAVTAAEPIPYLPTAGNIEKTDLRALVTHSPP